MNRKNMLFVIVGILLISTRMWLSFGTVYFDITNDIIGFVLIILGMKDLRTLNSRFKKGFVMSLLGLLASAASQLIMVIDWKEAESSMLTAAIGLGVIFNIYFTYYFTEALILTAKAQEKLAVTRNYQSSWLLLSGCLFVHYFVFKANTSIGSILLEALIAVLAFFYCYTVYTTSKQLYED